jgi:prepilin-type processing-associated H-X9-DG protein
MKHNVIRYSVIVLLIGLVAVAADRANAQINHSNEIMGESFSWGIARSQTARVSVMNVAFADGSVKTVRGRIHLLDTDGEVVAQSDEIRVEPGQTRFWDAPYEQIIGAREPTGRLQLRARILFEKRSFDRNRPPLVTLEIFEPSTGVTTLYNPFVTVDYIDSTTGQR